MPGLVTVRSAPAAAETSRTSSLALKLSTLGAGLILLALLADAGLRFLPREKLAFRAWEAAEGDPYSEGPLTPNLVYQNRRAFGDLANIGNLPGFRQFRSETFSTDPYGYRNGCAQTLHQPVDGIFLGDSFIAGASVNDDDTLSQQLSRLSGNCFFNAGGPHAEWPRARALIERLNMHGKLVVWEQSERYAIAQHIDAEAGIGARGKLLRSLLPGSLVQSLHASSEKAQAWLQYSPLEILLNRQFRKLQNGRWLPNPGVGKVVVGSLQNGQSMLFLKEEVDNYWTPPSIPPPAYFAELQSLVRSTGNELLVILVPDKYAVYQPLLSNAAGQNAAMQPDSKLYLTGVEAAARSAAVNVVNLIGPLRRQAGEEMARGEYNYWLDDTHWNAAGIGQAARTIHSVLAARDEATQARNHLK
ncbi:MAG TPA: hypothetical protein VKG79_17680 [Bryobacteraceae bacterium]|nr:hypothetical protein [Bryobacteraceae bacterium]